MKKTLNQKNDWRKDLSSNEIERLDKLHINNPFMHLKVLILVGIWLLSAWVATHFTFLPLKILCWTIIGFCIHGMAIFAHEGAHGSLTKIYWLDRIIGFFCGLPGCFPCNNYRATHLLHHEFENTSKDPDNLDANIKHPILRSLVFYIWAFVGMPIYILVLIVTGPIRAKIWYDRLICLFEPLLMTGIYIKLFQYALLHHEMDLLINGWLMALPFTVIIANIRGLAEHTQIFHETPVNHLKSTRTTLTNGWISFFFNNQNYHLEHHLFPHVPWYNLPKVYEVLKNHYEKKQATICKSYTDYMLGVLRYGPLKPLTYKNMTHYLDKDHL